MVVGVVGFLALAFGDVQFTFSLDSANSLLRSNKLVKCASSLTVTITEVKTRKTVMVEIRQ